MTPVQFFLLSAGSPLSAFTLSQPCFLPAFFPLFSLASVLFVAASPSRFPGSIDSFLLSTHANLLSLPSLVFLCPQFFSFCSRQPLCILPTFLPFQIFSAVLPSHFLAFSRSSSAQHSPSQNLSDFSLSFPPLPLVGFLFFSRHLSSPPCGCPSYCYLYGSLP